jgi:hypothetical protein
MTNDEICTVEFATSARASGANDPALGMANAMVTVSPMAGSKTAPDAPSTQERISSTRIGAVCTLAQRIRSTTAPMWGIVQP